MSIYFAKQIEWDRSLNNNLQKEFRKHCLKIDRQLLCSDQEMNSFADDLKLKLEELQNKHHRCKPLNWRDDDCGGQGYDDAFRFVGVNGVAFFAIYQANTLLGGRS